MPVHHEETTWQKYVQAGQAFAAEDFLIGMGGLVSHLQLFNPVASGIRVRLRSVHSILTVAVSHTVRIFNTPLTGLNPPAGFIIANLLGGAPAAVAEIRNEQNVAILGTGFWQLNAPGNVPAIYPPGGREFGFDLLEGQGILLQAGTAVTIIANWQWAEVPL